MNTIKLNTIKFDINTILNNGGSLVDIDSTLTQEGQAADAKTVGNKLATLSLKVGEIEVKTATALPADGVPVANTSYKLGTIASLALNGIPTSDYETTIYFTAGEGFTMSIPDCEIVGELSAEAGKSYVMSILNGVVVMGEVESYNN